MRFIAMSSKMYARFENSEREEIFYFPLVSALGRAESDLSYCRIDVYGFLIFLVCTILHFLRCLPLRNSFYAIDSLRAL